MSWSLYRIQVARNLHDPLVVLIPIESLVHVPQKAGRDNQIVLENDGPAVLLRYRANAGDHRPCQPQVLVALDELNGAAPGPLSNKPPNRRDGRPVFRPLGPVRENMKSGVPGFGIRS